MIPDLLAALIAISLVCIAALDRSLFEAHGAILAASGAVLVLLGVWELRSDYLKWPGATVITAGIVIVLLVLSGLAARSSEWLFWVGFWSGNAAGVVSLWSALYRGPGEARDPA